MEEERQSESRGAGVIGAEVNAQPLPDSAGWIRVPIDRTLGSRHLEQRILRLRPGGRYASGTPGSETVAYCVEGSGHATVGGERWDLLPGTALLVPPGEACRWSNGTSADLEVVIVVSPQPGRASPATPEGPVPRIGGLSVSERDEQPLPAGDDRYFKLLIDPRYGCRNMTQFVGFIERSGAPFHAHTYEEAIYILEGQGIVHIGERHLPIRRGSSIFLPPGTPHCLENEGPDTLKLLGVFSPAGSPAARRGATRGAPRRGQSSAGPRTSSISIRKPGS
jgi:quercetin dioxygenase-like cupin family protein